jgi:putative acetyltransferase
VRAGVRQVVADPAGVVGVEVVAELVLVREPQLAVGALVDAHGDQCRITTVVDVIVRRELDSDAGAVHAVHLAAFGRAMEPDLADALRGAGDTLPALTFVVEADGAVVGSVVTSVAHVGAVPVPAIGPVGVLPAWQRRGVGSALLHAVVGAADALGEQCLVLLGHPAYYPRFGFGAPGAIVPPDPAWGEAFQVRRLTAWDGSLAGTFRFAPAFG